ncbi:MAG TPA: hypothetical protein GX692_08240 [Acholeplasmataceae bacterium]|jgi:ABC-type antimicrobial peptide transport system permease subunit|nr:hypothetical protein [Acholeplasmataceae bacterium]
MNLFKLSFSQNKSRFFFTLIALMIAGIALTFSLFYTSSIKQNLAKSLPLRNGEIHLFVNERIYKEVPVNFYEKLKEEFDIVIPFVSKDTLYNEKIYRIIGTDINGNKLFINNQFLNFEITEQLATSSDYPQVYLHENVRSNLEGNLIQINNKNFEIAGFYKLDSDSEEDLNNIILSLDDYANGIDETIKSETPFTRFIIDDYYLKTNLDEENAIQKIISVYNDPQVRFSLNTHASILRLEMQQFLLFESVPTIFFIFVTLFSIINIYITIKLAIRERRKFYTVLTFLGMKLRHLKLMLLLEVSFISVIAGFGALLLGIGISFITISLNKELVFAWTKPELLVIVLLTMVFLPIIQTLISVQSIKYKHIIN